MQLLSLLAGLVLLGRSALSFIVHPTHLWSSSSCPSRFQQQKRSFLSIHTDSPPILDRAATTLALAARGPPAFLSDEAVSCYQNLDTGSTVYLVGVIHDARRSSKVIFVIHARYPPPLSICHQQALLLAIMRICRLAFLTATTPSKFQLNKRLGV